MIANLAGPAQDASAAGIDRDLMAAGQLQRMLLPPSPHVAHGWKAVHRFQPAGLVSGDYLDLVPQDGRLYFMLGDVSGKGIVASILMAQLHAMFRTLIPFGLPMEELMSRASALLCASSLPAQYATLVFGFVTEDGEVAIANAGHPPPVVVSARNIEVRATGMPVGLFCESQFASTRLSLAKGETLFLYTDGLTEAESSDGEEYGIARLEAVASQAARYPVDAFVDAIIADHVAHRMPGRVTDDVSVMALRRLSDEEQHPTDDKTVADLEASACGR